MRYSEENFIKCPVCGTDVDLYDICEKCRFQNTGKINIDGGPNKVKLKEAIKNYKKVGISDPNDDYCKIILNEKNKRWLFIIFMIKYTYKLIFKYFAKNRFCSFNFC